MPGKRIKHRSRLRGSSESILGESYVCTRFSAGYLSLSLSLHLVLLFGAVRPQLFPRYFSPCERLATRCLIIAVKIIIPMDQPSPCRRYRRRHRRRAAASSSRREPRREPCNYNTSVECESRARWLVVWARGREDANRFSRNCLRLSAFLHVKPLQRNAWPGQALPVGAGARTRERSLACRGTEDTAN